MINSVQTSNINGQSPFSIFEYPKNGYYIPMPLEDRKLVKEIVASSVIVGFGLLFFSRSYVSKATRWVVDKLRPVTSRLARKTEGKEPTKSQKFFKNVNIKTHEYLNKSESVNNLVTVRDTWFKDLIYKTTPTRKAHQKITEWFGRIGAWSAEISYKRFDNRFLNLQEHCEQVSKELLKDSSKAGRLKEIDACFKEIEAVNNTQNGFSKSARLTRRKETSDKAGQVADQIYAEYKSGKIKGMLKSKSKEIYQEFYADKLMKDQYKTSLSKNVDEKQQHIITNLKNIINAYKELLGENNISYKLLKKEFDSASTGLNKAVTKEMDFVDMMRDVAIGSGPTDVLSVLGSFGAAAWGLSFAKDKDERISLTLKYGIPIVGAVTTSLLCTASLIAGSKSLIVGTLSGFLMNRIGEIVDAWRKKNL